MLEDVVKPGNTGEQAAIPGYRVAGKTGTTQKVIDGTYSDEQYVAFFAGYAPSRDPRVMTLVIVDDPDGDAVPRRRGRGTGLLRGHRQGPAGAGRAPAEGSVASPA